MTPQSNDQQNQFRSESFKDYKHLLDKKRSCSQFESYLVGKFIDIPPTLKIFSRQGSILNSVNGSGYITKSNRNTGRVSSQYIPHEIINKQSQPQPQPQQIQVEDEVDEKELIKLRRKFSTNKFKPLNQNDIGQNQIQMVHDQKILKNDEQIVQFKLPQWITSRIEYKQLTENNYFNVKKKIISICEITSFKRSYDQKVTVAIYLEKLPLFKLMPFEILTDIGGRVTTSTYNQGECICKQGDTGDQLYIIYQGSVDVIKNDIWTKNYKDNSILGKNALEQNIPRTATLKVTQTTYVINLNHHDYYDILKQIIVQKRPSWKEFILSIYIFKDIQEKKLEKLILNSQAKYLSQSDNLFQSGDKVDNMYIVQQGVLLTKKTVFHEDKLRWPIENKKWIVQTVTKTYKLNVLFPAGSVIGLLDFQIMSEMKPRVETIDSQEDCFLLYISKSAFFEIFDSDDLDHFIELMRSQDSIGLINEQFQQKKKDDVQKIQLLKQAQFDHIQSKIVGQRNTVYRQKNQFKYLIQDAKKSISKQNQHIHLINSEKTQNIVGTKFEK